MWWQLELGGGGLWEVNWVIGMDPSWMGLVPLRKRPQDFPGGVVDKNLPANAEDTGSIPGLGRSHIPRGNLACAQATAAKA